MQSRPPPPAARHKACLGPGAASEPQTAALGRKPPARSRALGDSWLWSGNGSRGTVSRGTAGGSARCDQEPRRGPGQPSSWVTRGSREGQQPGPALQAQASATRDLGWRLARSAEGPGTLRPYPAPGGTRHHGGGVAAVMGRAASQLNKPFPSARTGAALLTQGEEPRTTGTPRGPEDAGCPDLTAAAPPAWPSLHGPAQASMCLLPSHASLVRSRPAPAAGARARSGARCSPRCSAPAVGEGRRWDRARLRPRQERLCNTAPPSPAREQAEKPAAPLSAIFAQLSPRPQRLAHGDWGERG